ncbi:DinB family protein [Edaphobacter modestus]|uniref:DinB family protein n=1 Tax=Edaphobacter modestus TaxID=388466 RepID=A0A4Q7YWZ3_9BACT|nr:DinB family protein [Edaphobacter modestus]RZU41934.1 DinB family protein [Edaphobacter modestus]
MKRIVFILALTLCLHPHAVSAQTPAPKPPPSTLKGVLLEQLHTTHDVKDWFVPGNIAVEGLTAEQARWTDGKGNHSVGQLTYHLVFWNKEMLAKFKDEKVKTFSGNNDETFNNFNAEQWSALVKEFNQGMTDWEKAVEAADDKTLAKGASLIAHIGTHNAYHIGQIIFVRKEQGSWNPEKGVK